MFDLFATNTLDLSDVSTGSYVYQVVPRDELKDASADYRVAFEVGR